LLVGSLLALAGDAPPRPAGRSVRVGVFNANRVYNQCVLVRDFNRKVDEWNRRLREAKGHDDEETRKAIRAEYTACRDKLRPRFDKALQRALRDLCAEKGIAVAFDDSARVAYLAKGVQTVQLGDDLIGRIGAADGHSPDANTPDAGKSDPNVPAPADSPGDANASVGRARGRQ
jgi:hypothetical protein